MEDAQAHSTHIGVRTRLIWGLQTLIVLMLTWLALNGLEGWWLGLGAATAGAMLGASLATGRAYPWRPHRLVAFAGFFLFESFRGGMDVAWRALSPKLRIEPSFVRHDLELPPGQPRTLLVSTLSLLPGTLSADLEQDGHALLVHTLVPEAFASIAVLEHWVGWLFSLETRAP